MVENRNTPTSYCQSSFLATQEQECLLWQSGHLKKCNIVSHPHTDTVFHQHKTPLCWLEQFSTLTSPTMRQKLGGCREACGMDAEMLGNHQPGEGVTAENWEDFNQFLTSYWALWGWSRPWWCVLEKIFNSWNSLPGKMMNSPLVAFSFRACVPANTWII